MWSGRWCGSSVDFRRQWAAPRACRRTCARAPTPGWPRAVRLAGAGASKPVGAHRRAPTVVATRRGAGRTRRPGWAGAPDRRSARAGRRRPPTEAGRGGCDSCRPLMSIQSGKVDPPPCLPQVERRLQSISMTGLGLPERRLRVGSGFRSGLTNVSFRSASRRYRYPAFSTLRTDET